MKLDYSKTLNEQRDTIENILNENKHYSLQLSQLQQEKEQIESDLYVSNMIIKDLLDSNEELIKYCENEIFSQNKSIELLSNKKYADIHIGAINAYKNVLSKLKESDKNEKDSSI